MVSHQRIVKPIESSPHYMFNLLVMWCLLIVWRREVLGHPQAQRWPDFVSRMCCFFRHMRMNSCPSYKYLRSSWSTSYKSFVAPGTAICIVHVSRRLLLKKNNYQTPSPFREEGIYHRQVTTAILHHFNVTPTTQKKTLWFVLSHFLKSVN